MARAATRLPAAGSRPLGADVLATIALVASIVFAAQASSVTVQTPAAERDARRGGRPDRERARAVGEPRGERGPYLVTWLPDAQAIGSAGYGLLNELDRRGFDVRAGEVFRPGATRYHVIDARRPTLEVHLATGPDIANWRRDSRFTRSRRRSIPDPTPSAREFDELHGQVVGDLRRAGLDRLVAAGRRQPVHARDRARACPRARRTMVTQMLDLSMPMAVFIGPPGKG